MSVWENTVQNYSIITKHPSKGAFSFA